MGAGGKVGSPVFFSKIGQVFTRKEKDIIANGSNRRTNEWGTISRSIDFKVNIVDINQFTNGQLWVSLLLFLPKLITAILIFLAFWLFGKFVQNIVHRFGAHRSLAPDITNLLRQTAWITFLIIGAISALSNLGIDMGAMIAGLGLTGFALGFALKDTVSNILAGFLLLIYKPFGRSDTITVGGEKGVISEINFRYTVLKRPGKTILIPNQSLFSNIVVVETPETDVKATPEVSSAPEMASTPVVSSIRQP
jgi:small-conductance mechanosensitive channel